MWGWFHPQGVEDCDDSNTNDTDECPSDCTIEGNSGTGGTSNIPLESGSSDGEASSRGSDSSGPDPSGSDSHGPDESTSSGGSDTGTTGSCIAGQVGCACDNGMCITGVCAEGSCVMVPDGMAFIIAGSFQDSGSGPNVLHKIDSFFIDQSEVTVAAYADCVDAGGCTTPAIADCMGDAANWGLPGRESHPINCVDYYQAVNYCRWAGKRLPTEWEWEWAARGGASANLYPWGNSPSASCEHAVMESDAGDGCGLGRTAAVGSRSPQGDTPTGLRDMVGNVTEWTSSWFDSSTELEISVRGGGWVHLQQSGLTTQARIADSPREFYSVSGFRCAGDL